MEIRNRLKRPERREKDTKGWAQKFHGATAGLCPLDIAVSAVPFGSRLVYIIVVHLSFSLFIRNQWPSGKGHPLVTGICLFKTTLKRRAPS
jgi:hypothetical protein